MIPYFQAIIDHALPPKTTGTVTKWLKAEGDEINEYDAVLELSTDSLYAPGDAPTDGPVCMIVELAEAGFVGRLFAAEGDTVEVRARVIIRYKAYQIVRCSCIELLVDDHVDLFKV